MKCHYEVLDIPKEATLSEIKSNYRKFALKWHPDKNLENTDYAKEQFQLVQQAYEVLSDPQERAWYDKHREQILLGSDSEFQDKSLDVFPYFTTTCFKGYSDDEEGFYAVYRGVFDKIIKEDLEFIEDKDEFTDIPRFGTSNSDYDEIVGPFYSYWSSYSTKKSYVWLDPYKINETRDRRILKLIDKENRKVRQKAKKERNEEIRNLVAFVRKRDKRVQEHSKLMEARIKVNRQKQKEISKMKRLERNLGEASEVGEWAKFDNVKLELEQIEQKLTEEFSDSDEEEITNDMYCVACNKLFRTVKAMENHEFSKKHKENLKILKVIMEEETENECTKKELGQESDNSEEDSEIVENTEISEEEIEIRNKKKKNKKRRNVIKLEEDEVNTSSDLELTKTIQNMSKEKTENSADLDENTSRDGKKQKKAAKKGITNKDVPEKSSKKSRRKGVENSLGLDLNHCCVNCRAEFQSKNKLFDHLKRTEHGVYLPPSVKITTKKNEKEK